MVQDVKFMFEERKFFSFVLYILQWWRGIYAIGFCKLPTCFTHLFLWLLCVEIVFVFWVSVLCWITACLYYPFLFHFLPFWCRLIFVPLLSCLNNVMNDRFHSEWFIVQQNYTLHPVIWTCLSLYQNCCERKFIKSVLFLFQTPQLLTAGPTEEVWCREL